MSRRGSLFVVSAPSGAGKTSLCQQIVAEMGGVVESVSYTTRAPRAGERDGCEYHFISPQVFEERVAAGAFLEWAVVHGKWYGTSQEQVETITRAGTDVLLTIDVQGAANLRDRGIAAVHIFVLPPSWEALEARLRLRGAEAEDTQAQRLAVARQELAHYTAYDYVIVNDNFSQAVADLQAIITAERHRITRVGTEPVAHLLD